MWHYCSMFPGFASSIHLSTDCWVSSELSFRLIVLIIVSSASHWRFNHLWEPYPAFHNGDCCCCRSLCLSRTCFDVIMLISGEVHISIAVVWFAAARTSLFASRISFSARVDGVWLAKIRPMRLFTVASLRDGIDCQLFFVVFFRFRILVGFLQINPVNLFFFQQCTLVWYQTGVIYRATALVWRYNYNFCWFHFSSGVVLGLVGQKTFEAVIHYGGI